MITLLTWLNGIALGFFVVLNGLYLATTIVALLVLRRYARRLIRGGPVHLRNPATSVVTWPLPLLTGIFAALAHASVLGSAFFFFLTVFIYRLLYRVMSLNAPRLPLGLARLL